MALYPVTGNADSTHTDTAQQYATLGKLQVVSYERRKAYVKIVPVGNVAINNVNIAALNTEVGKIYDSVGVTMNLVLGITLNDNTWNDGIVVDGTGLFSTESVNMKALQTAYEAQYGKSDTAVLFLLPSLKTTNNQQIEGDMPRGKRYGYLNATTLTTTSLLAGTIAHELGHGIFRLDHTFADHYNIAKGALPENVMDYATPQGGHFNKHQWDAINKPGLVIGVFEGDEDAMAYHNIGGIPKTWRSPSDSTLNFITPAKQIVRLSKNVVQAYFTFGIGEYNGYPLMPSGVLKSYEKVFNQDTITYYAKYENGTFVGYINNQQQYDTYLANKGDTESKTAIMLLATNKGFAAYRLSGLALPYLTTNSSQPIINVLDANSVKLNATNWNKVTEYDFKDGEVVFGVSTTLINPSFVGTMAALVDNNGEYFVLSKIMEYRTVYPDIYDRMTTTFGNWSGVSTWAATLFNDLANVSTSSGKIQMLMGKPKEQVTAGYFDYRCRDSSWYNLPKAEQYIKFLQTFREAIDSFQVANEETIFKLMVSSSCVSTNNVNSWFDEELPTTENLKNAVVAMSIEQLQSICAVKRAQAVAIILDKFIVTESYENAIYKLMWTCPVTNTSTEDFLLELNNLKYNNKHLLGLIASAIDDETVFMGSDLNTYVMKYFQQAYAIAIKNKNSPLYNTYIKPVLENTVTGPDFYASMSKRAVTYNYTSFGKRLFKTIVNGAVGAQVTDNDVKSVVAYDENTGKLEFKNQSVNGFIPQSSYGDITFNPFEPIILDVKGNLVDVYGEKDKTPFVPAYLLYFAEKKADATTTQAAVQTAADVISLAIPGGQATLALRVLNYADKLSSVMSIAGTMSAEDYPQFAKVMNISSTVLGVTSLGGNLTHWTPSNVNNLSNLAGNASEAAKLIKADDVLNSAKHIQEVEVLCGKITSAASGSDIAAALSNAKAREFMLTLLEAEKEAARVAGKTQLVTKIEQATAKLISGYTITTKASFVSLLKSKFPKFNGLFASDSKYIFADGKLKYLKDGTSYEIAKLSADGKSVEVMDNIADNAIAANHIEEVTENAALICKNGACELVEGGCFTAGTLVTTQNGIKAIETIQTGDSVKAYDELQMKWSWGRVAQTATRIAGRMYNIVCGTDTLSSTGDHPYYTDSGWQEAKLMKRGTKVLLATGVWAMVSMATYTDSAALVYNIEVLPQHNYYVGNSGLLVHNGFTCFKKKYSNLANASDEFFDDFVDNAAMLAKFNSGELSYDAWQVLKNRTTQRINPMMLSKVDEILNSSKLGITKAQMIKISELHATTGASCGNCINSFEKTLDNIKNIENHIENPTAFAKVLDDLTGTSNQFRGADWALQVVKEKPLAGNIIEFEAKLDDAENYTTDILTRDGSILHYNECKNYSGNANFLASTGSNFVTQFSNTLSKITSFDQMHYFFHTRYARNLKSDIIAALESTKGRNALTPLILNGKLQSLFPPTTIITSTDDFINQINRTEIFNAIFN